MSRAALLRSRLTSEDEETIRAAMRARRADLPAGDLADIAEAVLLLERAGLRAIGCTAAAMRDAELEQIDGWAREALAR